MNFGCLRRIFACWALPGALVLSALIAVGQTPGIYADFTTSLGNFTCQLDYTNAPRTTANFIGLATGQRAWLDLPTGRARTDAFYNGLTFHRVIAGFMNQSGSPNGQGTDGPGYVFTDEFSPNLVFDSFGVLAMANSGTNSNGAQFFVTVAPFVSGNNTYAIFGRVVSGSNVVYAINHVATDASDKPLTNVVLQQVTIRRVGTAAQAFNIHAQSLPIVTNLPLKIVKGVGQVTLTFSNRAYADNRLYSSTNINQVARVPELLGIETTAPSSNSVSRTNDAPRRFFSLAQIQYASSTLAPKTLYGRTLALSLTVGGSGTLTLVFDSTGGGTYTFPPNPPGTMYDYIWTQEAYRGRLLLALPGYPILSLRCDFSSGGGGTFTGTAYPNYPSDFGSFPVGGTFSLSAP